MSSEQKAQQIVENLLIDENKQSEGVPYSPGPDAEDITPDKDGGVLKEIKRSGVWGTEGAQPMKGDSVSVHYVGTLLDGSKFDSSRDRGEYFNFTLGTGQVIKAWDLGVATMKKGELAVFTCKAEYAYGEAGSPPKIPPNATLVFEVELFSWKGEDVSAEKDEGVMRSILEKGAGLTHPKDGATCQVHIVGRHDGADFEKHDVSFVLGEGSESGVVDGVEQALKKFTKSEKSLLQIKAKYAYGEEGHKEYNIPPNADLEYEVTLKEFEKCKESWEMDSKEKLEQSELMKQKGTDFFKKLKYPLAKRYYKKIIDFLENESSLEGEESKKRDALLLAAHLNMAMCYLKLSDDLEAIHSCDKALEIDSHSEKGLFRRATAQQNMQNYVEALQDFKAVLELDPNNKAAKNQITITNNKIKQQQQKEMKTYAGMFEKFAQTDNKREAADRARYWNSDLLINEWDNKMADGMLPIEEEVAAFGEVMPEPKYNREDCKENMDPADD